MSYEHLKRMLGIAIGREKGSDRVGKKNLNEVHQNRWLRLQGLQETLDSAIVDGAEPDEMLAQIMEKEGVKTIHGLLKRDEEDGDDIFL